jgi:hypothetical protein
MSCAQVENFKVETVRQSTISTEPKPFVVFRKNSVDVASRIAAALDAALANGSMPA